ncbi:MAG: hypothetical protein ACJ79K_03485 [Gemmatimonadaceae bacterium]
MKFQPAALALVSVIVRGASAQSASRPAAVAPPTGTWRGTSTCLVHRSACHDEIVVYRITPMHAADSVTVDARKIVGGEEQEMGVLACRFTSSSGRLTCSIPRGVWSFTVREDSLTGDLRLSDNTRFRDVRTARDRTRSDRHEHR